MNFIDGDDDWDDYIPLIQHSYNSTPNTMTTYSPNHIIFGNDFKIALDRINQKPSSRKTPKEYIHSMNNKRKIVNNAANLRQNKYRVSRSATYNKDRIDSIEYEIGDVVLIDVARRLVGNEKKLKPSWIGPFEIFNIVDKQYWCREIGNESNIQKVNLRMIKPYKSSPYINVLNRCLLMMDKSDDPMPQRFIDYTRRKFIFHSK